MGSGPEELSAKERNLIVKIARCAIIKEALGDSYHPCHAVVASQQVPEGDRQVPEAWAGNLRGARVVFLSSNPSISEPIPGMPLDSAEAYPRSALSDTEIIQFQGHRFDQTLPRPFVKDGHYLQQNGHYAKRGTRFWSSIQHRAVELLGPAADPSVNYVMTEVVHCKSRREAGVSRAAKNCAGRYLDQILSLTSAPLIVVVGRKAHDCVNDALNLDLPEPPYVTERILGGRHRQLVFIWHPSSFKPNKTFAALHGDSGLRRLQRWAV
jgi:hypothetical protein